MLRRFNCVIFSVIILSYDSPFIFNFFTSLFNAIIKLLFERIIKAIPGKRDIGIYHSIKFFLLHIRKYLLTCFRK